MQKTRVILKFVTKFTGFVIWFFAGILRHWASGASLTYLNNGNILQVGISDVSDAKAIKKKLRETGEGFVDECSKTY